jgi:hypothetical protein
MLVNSILLKKTSFQNDTWSPVSDELTIKEVLLSIKNKHLEGKILGLRNLLENGELDKYDLHKRNLPCVTFCGTFDGARKREKIVEYNNIIVLDIDKLDPIEISRVSSALSVDKHVFAFWKSPSGAGIKGLVSISFKFNISNYLLDKLHKNAFGKLYNYYLDRYSILLDNSGSDTTRLCFLSSDSSIVIKEECTAFEVDEEDIRRESKESKSSSVPTYASSRDKLFNPKNKNQPFHRKQIQCIIKYLEKRDLSITFTYEMWYRVAYSISNTFTYDVGLNYYISLCKLDSEKFNESNCRNMLNYCYENSLGQITFSTILYLAYEKGFKVLLQRSEVSKTAF